MTTKTSKNNGLIVGAIFTVCSFLLTFTFVVPVISVLPGVFLEATAKKIISNNPYSNVGKLTTLLLTIVFLVEIVLILLYTHKKASEKQTVSKGKIMLFMFAFYFIVHPLGFYVYWGLFLNFRGDGQVIFAAVVSFPISSLLFVLFGLLIDCTYKTFDNKALHDT